MSINRVLFTGNGMMQNSPIFSTSQGNVKVSPTTALYVCPCVINLACVVDDVVASDLLPNGKRRERKMNAGKFKSLWIYR